MLPVGSGIAVKVTFFVSLSEWVGRWCVRAIRVRPGLGCSGRSGGGLLRRSEVPLPFTVTSSCQECPSPARTDHVLHAPTLFLTRLGGSVAGFRNDRGARGAFSPSPYSPPCRTSSSSPSSSSRSGHLRTRWPATRRFNWIIIALLTGRKTWRNTLRED